MGFQISYSRYFVRHSFNDMEYISLRVATLKDYAHQNQVQLFVSQETAGTQNTSGFANVDSAFILSYAIIILNVDQVL